MRLDYLKMHFVIFLWGFTAILGVLISLTALEVVFYRTLIAATGTALLILLMQRKRPLAHLPEDMPLHLRPPALVLVPRLPNGAIHWRRMGQLLGIGIIIGLHWLSFFGGSKVANVSVCLAGLATASLWTAFIEPIFHRKAIKWFEIILGVVVVLGLYIIFYFEFGNRSYMLGLALGITAAFLAAIFSTLNGVLSKTDHHYTITLYEMIGACLTAVLGMLAFSYFGDTPLHLLPKPLDWLWLLLLGGVCTVYAYSVSVELLRRISVFTMNLAVNLEPLYGILLAALFFGEHQQLTRQFYLGASVVLLAVFLHPLLQRWEKRQQMLKNLNKI
ncbi:MAG: DMT family transporter [Bernardetiaceae bacterium]